MGLGPELRASGFSVIKPEGYLQNGGDRRRIAGIDQRPLVVELTGKSRGEARYADLIVEAKGLASCASRSYRYQPHEGQQNNCDSALRSHSISLSFMFHRQPTGESLPQWSLA
jgi:hypothetical protein